MESCWIIPVIALVVLEYCAAYSIGVAVGFHYELALNVQLSSAAVFATIIIFSAFVFFFCRCIVWQVDSPIHQLKADVVNYGLRILVVAAGVCLVSLHIGAMNWTKSMIPLVTSFWADPLLADFDRFVFGKDPWLYFSGLPLGWLDEVYITWAIVKFLTLLTVLCLPASQVKSTALLSYFLMIFVGNLVLQYALPSGGPIFYERLGYGDDFADMPVLPMVQLASDYLWQAYERAGGVVGGGISAFPSGHVAVSCWIALTAVSYKRWLGIVAGVYYALIFVGSIYLGWHYAADGVGATGIALIAFFVSKKYVRFCQRKYAG